MINDRYVIKKKLGEGRSKVFLCSDLENPSEDVAIKILPVKKDIIEIENFRGEFITLRKLNHPNIIEAKEYGAVLKEDEIFEEPFIGCKYFTEEFFDGKNLLKYGNLGGEDILKIIIAQICSSLFYLHQSGYIYYDLKPENILVKQINGEPFIKLVDLGFANKTPTDSKENGKVSLNSDTGTFIRGTAQYIAPELLRNKYHDQRVDLYSLGIILYRIVYGKFPFNTDNELKIYKAHLEQDFKFEKTKYSKQLINVIKKLLEKEPEKRYENSYEILYDLDIHVNSRITKDWIPVRVFTNRRDVLNILDTYIRDQSSNEIFSIKGFEGSGKSAIAEQINSIYNNSVLIKYDKSKSGYSFLKSFLKDIIYKDFIFTNISEELKLKSETLLENLSQQFSEEFKGIVSGISQKNSFILILDDFNSFDTFTMEMMKDIIPIFQVNKVKLIITEDSDYDSKSDSFHNIREINLTPFTDTQVSEFIETAYPDPFPKEELKKIILLYADLLPGSIENFVRDCLQLNVIQYKRNKIEIKVSETSRELLKGSHDQIYEIRINNLSVKAAETAKILSLFEMNLDSEIAADLQKLDKGKFVLLARELTENNILHPLTSLNILQFTSQGLKKHVYNSVDDKKTYHLNAAATITRNHKKFDRNELARQYELGEKYDECYTVLMEEIEEAEKISAYSYIKGILKYLQKLPLNEEKIFVIELKLGKVLKNLNEFKECISVTDSLLTRSNRKDVNLELLLQKGKCLIALNDSINGKRILEKKLMEITNSDLRTEMELAIAHASFNLSNYDEAEGISSKVINNKNAKAELVADAYNLMALIRIYRDNELDEALYFFQNALNNYQTAQLKLQIAKMIANIGNIFNYKGEYAKVEEYWAKALEINLTIGNLLNEAVITSNYGIFYYNNNSLEKAVQFYTRALIIFQSLGDLNNEALVLNNLGESYLVLCEYQKTLDSLMHSKKIWKRIHNIEEQIENLFILGKLYFMIGDINSLKVIRDEGLKKSTKSYLGIKYQNFLSWLECNYSVFIDKEYNNLSKLKNIAYNFFKSEDEYNFTRVCFNIIEIYIILGKTKEAKLLLDDNDLIRTSSSRLFLQAERLYLLGKLHNITRSDSEETSITFFRKSFNLIKDEIITELTWKVLLEIADCYSSRGNYIEARKYIEYCKSVIYYISEKIEDKELKTIYLNREDRKNALKKIELLEVQTINNDKY